MDSIRRWLNVAELLAVALCIGDYLSHHVEASAIVQQSYNLVQNAGSPLARRTTINCTGGITCSDSGGITVFNGVGGNPFSDPGVFDNSTMATALQGLITGTCSVTTEFQTGQPAQFADTGTFGCVIIPSNSTEHQGMGIFGATANGSTTTNGVGGYFSGRATAAGSGATDGTRVRIWGVNPLLTDAGFTHVLLTNELDFNVSGSDTHILGLQFTGAGSVDMTSDSAGIIFGALGGTHQWPVALYCSQGATSNSCVKLDPTSSANNVGSQAIKLLSRTSGGTLNTFTINTGAGGSIIMGSDTTGGFTFQRAGVNQFIVTTDGGAVTQTGLALASLTPTTNGTILYCTDCANASNPCNTTGPGTGAFAKRLNGAWDCR